MKKLIISAAQVLFFILVSLSMSHLADWLHLKIPGSILGIFLVFILLQSKVLRLEWIDLGAKWLLAEMLLFFIPSAAGLIQYKSLLLGAGIRIMLVLIGSTAIVMMCAGIIAQKIVQRKERKHS